MQKYSLTVKKREILGKKIKKLRREGILPANVYGKGITSVAVQVPLTDFQEVYRQAGETGVIELHIDGEKRPVLIKNLQLNYVNSLPVHVDFYQVNLKEKIRTMVPVILIGEAKAVTEKLGLLMQTLNEVEVEALPTDLPEKLELDITDLEAVDEMMTVADIKKPTNVELLTNPEQTVAIITELVSKEAEEQAQEEKANSAEAKAEKTEEITAAGETPSEEKTE